MAQSRPWLQWILVSTGLLVLAMWAFVKVTSPVLHPDPQKIPSTTQTEPLPQSTAAAERARQIVRATLREKNLSALSVAVGIGGDIVWAEGFGFADLKSNVPLTPSHRFRIGTAAIALTSAAAGLLLEEGRLNLDSEIQNYVPTFPRKQWPVTLRELMADTSGVTSDSNKGPLFTEQCERTLEALPRFEQGPLLFEPGTQYQQSIQGWILVSAALESAADQPFLTFMRERIFEPLRMRDTVADTPPKPDNDFPLFNLFLEKVYDPQTARSKTPNLSKKQDRVTPYSPRYFGDANYGMHVTRPLDFSCYAGSGVFVSTPSDMVRFGMAIQSDKLLQPATVQLLQTPQRLSSGEDTGHGFGWDLKTATVAGKQTRVIGHNGEVLGGISSSLITLPEHSITVSVMSNMSDTDTFSIAVKIAESFAQPARK